MTKGKGRNAKGITGKPLSNAMPPELDGSSSRDVVRPSGPSSGRDGPRTLVPESTSDSNEPPPEIDADSLDTEDESEDELEDELEGESGDEAFCAEASGGDAAYPNDEFPDEEDPPVVPDAELPDAQKQKGNGKKNNGLWLSYAPLSDIDGVFADMTTNALKQGLDDSIERLAGRSLKIATMCSGTEAPILALSCIKEALDANHSKTLMLEHLFSAEIEPYKQAYIERNFEPPILFRDVLELKDDFAHTAYGSLEKVPGGADILVAGSSCVDFSNLNGNKPQSGESKETHDALIEYAKKFHPVIVIVENIDAAPWAKMESAWQAAGYAATHLKVDSKDYYVPQIRNRGYLVALNMAKVSLAGLQPQDLLAKWKSVMISLRRPASSHAIEFLLPKDDLRLQQLRRDIESAMLERNKSEWDRCKTRYSDYRVDNKLGLGRPMTNWQDGGNCKVPGFFWAKWAKGQVERIWDTLDINLLRGIVKNRDSRYVARFWDLSQNVDRETDARAPGVIGCLTPSGQPFVSTRGGPLTGLEALSLQALPLDKMNLTRETGRQLQNMAGNAMTSTVVGAAILSALIAGYELLPLEMNETHSNAEATAVPLVLDWPEVELESSELNLGICRPTAIASLLHDVRRATRLCDCEKSTEMKPSRFFRCELCLHTACVLHKDNPLHDYKEILEDPIRPRISYEAYREALQEALPTRLTVENLSIEALEQPRGFDIDKGDWAIFCNAVKLCAGEELRLKSISRDMSWTVNYDGANSRLQLTLSKKGAQWLLFAKVPTSEPGNSRTRQVLSRPIARMIPKDTGLLDGSFEIHYPVAFEFKIHIRGAGNRIDCPQKRLGLEHEQFRERKVWTKFFIECGSSVTKELAVDIRGEYDYLEHCGTAMNSLHRQIRYADGQAASDGSAVSLFFDQDELGLSGKDSFVFAMDHEGCNRGDTREVLARVAQSFNLHDVPENGKPFVVKCSTPGRWKSGSKASLSPFTKGLSATYSVPHNSLVVDSTPSSCASSYITMLECEATVSGDMSALARKPRKHSDNTQTTFQLFAFLIERAKDKVPFGQWQIATSRGKSPKCALCVPLPPQAVLRKSPDGQIQVYEDEKQAGRYERNVKARPKPVMSFFELDENNVARIKIGVNVATLLHRAKSRLAAISPDNEVAYNWRLVTNVAPMPRRGEFTIPGNRDDVEFQGSYSFVDGYSLRPEQRRELGWAVRMDQEGIQNYEEEEIEEALVPSMNWRVEGRATITRAYKGGAMNSAVGYGKTIMAFALYGATCGNRFPLQDVNGAISIKATLILVPKHLMNQWRGEAVKFLGKGVRLLRITTNAVLAKLTVRDFQDADIILMPWNLLVMDKSGTLLGKMQAVTACRKPPNGTSLAAGRAKTQWFKNAMPHLEANIEQLKQGNLGDLSQRLRERRSQIEDEDASCPVFEPSKRLRGAAYQKAISTATSLASRSGYKKLTVDVLKRLCKQRGIRLLSRDKKQDIIDKLTENEPREMSAAEEAVPPGESSQAEQPTDMLMSDVPPAVASTQLSTADLKKLTSDILKEMCKTLGLQTASRPRKEVLVDALFATGVSSGDVSRAADAPSGGSAQVGQSTHVAMSNVPPVTASTALSTADLTGLTNPVLMQMCKARDIHCTTRSDKTELVNKLLAVGAGSGVVPGPAPAPSGGSDQVDRSTDMAMPDALPAESSSAAPPPAPAPDIMPSPDTSSSGVPHPEEPNESEPSSQEINPSKRKATSEPDSENVEKAKMYPFGIDEDEEEPDLGQVKNPLLHMFHFDRLVIDEFTYLEGKNDSLIKALKARSKWILSATPGLGSFGEVKLLSNLIGIKLGIDDNDKAMPLGWKEKNATMGFELMESFAARRSTAWHNRRAEVAQNFLNLFARKNEAEIDEILSEEHNFAVKRSEAEQAIYAELFQQVGTQEATQPLQNIRTSASGNDRLDRLKAIIRDCETTQDALLHAASDFIPPSGALPADTSQACGQIVEVRKHQKEEREAEMKDLVNQATRLERLLRLQYDASAHEDNSRSTFSALKHSITTGAAWDASVIDDLRKYTAEAESDLTFQSRDTDPQDPDETRTELKNVCHTLRKCALECQKFERSYRFFQRVFECQEWMAIQHADDNPPPELACENCGTNSHSRSMNILTSCGHVVCDSCLATPCEDERCWISGCNANWDANYIEASDLADCSGDRSSVEYGAKIAKLLRLLKGEIGGDSKIEENHQVLLFIQFPAMKDRVADALRANDISFSALEGGKKKRAKQEAGLTPFIDGKTKVLILDLDKESAAGLNLTMARHVVFFAPLLCANKQKYQAQMLQAIGRARRFGQKETVHIHRLFSLKTIDVNTVEDREERLFVLCGDEAALVGPGGVVQGDVCFRGRDLPSLDVEDWEEE